MSTTPTQALLSALERDRGGVAVVRWPTFDLRDWLISEVKSLLPDAAHPDVVATVEDALKVPSRAVLLVPDVQRERDAVDELEGCRELLIDRTQPLVLFLSRDGEGGRALRERPSLASWIRGNDVDPDAMSEIDVAAERAQFVTDAGETPERWLERWHVGEVERTGANYARAYRASMLVAP